MKLPYKYDKNLLIKATSEHFGINKIDLDSPENVEKAISLILNLLDLENELQVQDTFGAPMTSQSIGEVHGYARFTLVSSKNLSKEKFLAAINKFQEFLTIEEPGGKTETEKAVDKISRRISSISARKDKLFVGLTNSKEPEVKAKCDMPQDWLYFHFSEHEYAMEVYNYFIRKGLQSSENRGMFSYSVYFFVKSNI